MKFSEIIYQKAELALKARREQAERLHEMRRKEFISKYPELLDIEAEMKNTALAVIKSISGGTEKVDVSVVAKRNLEAQAAKKALIVSAGYPEDYLDIPYTCKLCNDTGIHNGKLCAATFSFCRSSPLVKCPVALCLQSVASIPSTLTFIRI